MNVRCDKKGAQTGASLNAPLKSLLCLQSCSFLLFEMQIQFHMKGPSGTGLVNADMYKDEYQQWQYTYLLVDVYAGNSRQPQRVHIVVPR